MSSHSSNAWSCRLCGSEPENSDEFLLLIAQRFPGKPWVCVTCWESYEPVQGVDYTIVYTLMEPDGHVNMQPVMYVVGVEHWQ